MPWKLTLRLADVGGVWRLVAKSFCIVLNSLMFTFVAELFNKSRLLYFLGAWTGLFKFMVANIFCIVLKSSLLFFG